MSYSMGYLFSQLETDCPGRVPSSACSCWGQSGKKKIIWCSTSTAQQLLKHRWVINFVLITNLKHSTTQAATEKIISIPTKPSTISTSYLILFTSCSHTSLSNKSSLSNTQPVIFWDIYADNIPFVYGPPCKMSIKYLLSSFGPWLALHLLQWTLGTGEVVCCMGLLGTKVISGWITAALPSFLQGLPSITLCGSSYSASYSIECKSRITTIWRYIKA